LLTSDGASKPWASATRSRRRSTLGCAHAMVAPVPEQCPRWDACALTGEAPTSGHARRGRDCAYAVAGAEPSPEQRLRRDALSPWPGPSPRRSNACVGMRSRRGRGAEPAPWLVRRPCRGCSSRWKTKKTKQRRKSDTLMQSLTTDDVFRTARCK
jgi:hypothetical protein